jgi:branched-chain amino acid transport system substrate-binding protein
MLKNIMKTAAIMTVGTLGCVGLATSVANADEPIKIGTFLSVTGGASFLGDPELKTMQMFIEDLNARGGILNRQVELIHYDSKTSSEEAGTFVKRLISQDKVDIIVGGSTTGNTMAVIKQIQKAEIPFISLAGAGVIVNPVKKWVFKTPHTDKVAVAKIFEDMKSRDLSKIGMLSGNGGFGKSCQKNARALADGAGIQILADETHGKGDTDMTPQITSIKSTAGVQAFLYCGFGAPTSIVAKNVRQLGLNVPHYQTHGSASMKFVKGADGAAEGVRLPAAALLVADQLAANHPQKAITTAYKAAYESRYNDSISTFGGHAYDGLLIATQAIERAGSTDKEAVRAEIEKTTNLIGVDGIFSMSAHDHLGLDKGSFVMVEVKNGGWKLIH